MPAAKIKLSIPIILLLSSITHAESYSLSPLTSAASRGDLPKLKDMLENGATVNDRDKYGRTSLHWAASRGKQETAEYLLAQGSDIKAKDNKGDTPLHITAYYAMAELLVANRADIHARNNDGRTPLDIAARRARKEIAQFLLEKGAAVSNIHTAAYLGDLPKVRDFLAEPNNANSKDSSGWVPLHTAALGGHVNMVNLLIAEGADPNYYGPSLSLAAKHGHSAVAELLIANGADLEYRNQLAWTPLYIAARNGHKAIAQLLVEKGAEIDAKDNH